MTDLLVTPNELRRSARLLEQADWGMTALMMNRAADTIERLAAVQAPQEADVKHRCNNVKEIDYGMKIERLAGCSCGEVITRQAPNDLINAFLDHATKSPQVSAQARERAIEWLFNDRWATDTIGSIEEETALRDKIAQDVDAVLAALSEP